MKNVSLFEIVPGTGIKVFELGEIPHDDACAKYIANEPRFRRGPTEPDKMPEQALRNKIARNFGWATVGSYFDKEHKCYMFRCAINADETVDRPVTMEDICKSMHWKSFEFCDNGLAVKFVNDLSWYDPLPAKPKTAKKRGRKAKNTKSAK